MKAKNAVIPRYALGDFTPIHRLKTAVSSFGCNDLDKSRWVEGFELYSSVGLLGSVGPLRSVFYRISITLQGSLDMWIGLEHYRHGPLTISFTVPDQIFCKNNISVDAFGYYMLFAPDFLEELMPSVKMAEEFPFLDGLPVFQLSAGELQRIVDLVVKMDQELKGDHSGRRKALQMYLYLILLEAKRSYERQELHRAGGTSAGHAIVSRFLRLVAKHYLAKRQVAEYAELLSVSPNHLNKVVKEATGRTASDAIRAMLVQEARSLLRYTDNSVSEIGYRLDFSDPASFNRFFKGATGETPLYYRNRVAHKE